MKERHHFVFIKLEFKMYPIYLREMCKQDDIHSKIPYLQCKLFTCNRKMAKWKWLLEKPSHSKWCGWEYLLWSSVDSTQLHKINIIQLNICNQDQIERKKLNWNRRDSFANVNISTRLHLVWLCYDECMNTSAPISFGLEMKWNRLDHWIIHEEMIFFMTKLINCISLWLGRFEHFSYCWFLVGFLLNGERESILKNSLKPVP